MAFSAVGAFAEEPKIVDEPGQPIALTFASGNRAELRVARAEPFAVPIEFQVSENSCTTGIGQKFEIKLGIRFELYSWIWTQHSDSNKLDKDVNFRLPDGRERPLTTGMIVSSGSRYIAPEAIEGLPADEISFTDGVKWIPGLEDGVFRKFSIESWNAETMIRNSQTGEVQNRIISGEYGTSFAPDGGGVRGVIEHTPGGAFFTNLLNHGFYLLGDVVTWSFRNGPKSTCQISFKPDVTKAENALVDYINNSKFEFKPIPGKQDGMAEALLSYAEDMVRSAVE